ncbi:MAG: hypothetical protein ACR2FO_07560 [Actinomycetota bacterium]
MTPLTQGSVIEHHESDEIKAPALVVVGNGQEPIAGPQQDSDSIVGEGIPLTERLVVSPCAGKFQPLDQPRKAEGEYVLKGQEVGTIMSSDRELVPVRSAFSGWIMGYLVPHGCPVRASEPVAWLRP